MSRVKPTILLRKNTDQDAMAKALETEKPAASSIPTPPPIPIGEDPNHFVIGQTYQVPLGQIMRSTGNARVFYDAAEIDQTSESLRKGQDVPAIGYVQSGKVVLTDGQKRFQAATSAGLEVLKVYINSPPASKSEEYEKSRRINIERSSQTCLDDAVRWQEFIESGVYDSQDHIAERLGVSKATVSKTLSINRIPERLMRAMTQHEKTRTLSIAYEISNIFVAPQLANDPDKAAELAQDVIEIIAKKELNRDQAANLIKDRIEGPRKRSSSESSQVKYGDDVGTLKVFPTRGQLDLSFRNLTEQRVDQLKAHISQMLAGQLTM